MAILFKIRLTTFILIGFSLRGEGQNLVPNPSFEDTLGCPEGYPDLDGKCSEWMSFRGTPDYFHNCSPMNGYNNWWGYQEPHSGESYAGIITYSVSGAMPPLEREYLGIQLISPLIIGEKYYISFYASTAWDPFNMNIASNKIGALFTTYPYYDYWSETPLLNISHIHTEDIISDTISWTKISGSFMVDSAYQYIMIGNFFEDSYTDTMNLPTQHIFNLSSFYYIDDVCVSTDSVYTHTWTSIKEYQNVSEDILLYPNPANEFITLRTNDLLQNVYIYSPLGQLTWQKQSINNNELVINVSGFQKGVYFLSTMSQEKIITKKIIIN